jgi:hypothetical protein
MASTLNKEKVKINDGHYGEMLDRLHVQMSVIEEHLFKHPISEQNKEVRESIIKAIVNLIKAYRLTGELITRKSKKTLPNKKKKTK